MTDGAHQTEDTDVGQSPPTGDANDADGASATHNEPSRDRLHEIITTEAQNKLLTMDTIWSSDELTELNKLSDQTDQQRARIIDMIGDKCLVSTEDLCSKLKASDLADMAEQLQRRVAKSAEGNQFTIICFDRFKQMHEEYVLVFRYNIF